MKFTKRFFFLAIMLSFLVISLYILNQSTYDLSAFSIISNASQQSSQVARLPENDVFDRFFWEKVALVNAKQTKVQNENLFSSLKDDALVIIVQVHKRLPYLRTLIKSLSRVKFIESALLVFSHDHIDDDINRLIEAINFTQVMITVTSLLYILLNIFVICRLCKSFTRFQLKFGSTHFLEHHQMTVRVIFPKKRKLNYK